MQKVETDSNKLLFMRNNSSLLFPPIDRNGQDNGTYSIESIQNDKPMKPNDIEDLLTKVTMNGAFLNLAKNDEQLVNDMKQAIVKLHAQAIKRDILYTAIEHNTKYICNIAVTSQQERDAAQKANIDMIAQIKQFKSDTDEMTRKIKVLSKDSEQLVYERNRAIQLTIDLAKANEKIVNTTASLKTVKSELM